MSDTPAMRASERERIAADVARFVAGGGCVLRVKAGASGGRAKPNRTPASRGGSNAKRRASAAETYGARAYELCASGATWAEVGATLGIPGPRAGYAAREWAKAHRKPWPLKTKQAHP